MKIPKTLLTVNSFILFTFIAPITYMLWRFVNFSRSISSFFQSWNVFGLMFNTISVFFSVVFQFCFEFLQSFRCFQIVSVFFRFFRFSEFSEFSTFFKFFRFFRFFRIFQRFSDFSRFFGFAQIVSDIFRFFPQKSNHFLTKK